MASAEQSKWFKDRVSLILGAFSQNSLQRCLLQKKFIQVIKALMHTISTTSALLSNLRVRCWPTQDCCFKDRVKTVDRGSNPGRLQFMEGALTTELPSQFVEESSTPTVVVARLHTTLCVTSANSVTLLRLLTQCLLIRAGPNTSAASIAYRTPRPSSYSPLHAHIRVAIHQGHTTTTI